VGFQFCGLIFHYRTLFEFDFKHATPTGFELLFMRVAINMPPPSGVISTDLAPK